MIRDSDNHDKDFDDFKADLEPGWNVCMVIYEGYENFDCDRSNMVMLVMLAMMVGAGTFGCMMMLILHVICVIYVSYDDV